MLYIDRDNSWYCLVPHDLLPCTTLCCLSGVEIRDITTQIAISNIYVNADFCDVCVLHRLLQITTDVATQPISSH